MVLLSHHHQQQRDIDYDEGNDGVERVQDEIWTYLNLLDSEIEEGVLGVHFDRRLGTDAAHGGTEATVELEHDELVEVAALLCIGDRRNLGVGNDHALRGRLDQIPIDDLAALLEERIEDAGEIFEILGEVGLVLRTVDLAILGLVGIDRLDQVVNRIFDRLRDRLLRRLVEFPLRSTVRGSEGRGREAVGVAIMCVVVVVGVVTCLVCRSIRRVASKGRRRSIFR